MSLLQFLQTFWGVLVVFGLGVYSLNEAIDGPVAVQARANSRAGLETLPTLVPMHTIVVPRGGFPTPAPTTILLACNGVDGDVARYQGSGFSYVILRIDTDRDMIILVMGGLSRFPANSTLIQTPCFRNSIRDGTFPDAPRQVR